MSEEVKQRFLEDTKNHTIEIIKNNGLYRHIKFSNNGSSVYRFDLITWPGYLAVSGDMGSWMFSRLPDMFEFFRTDINEGDPRINLSYWAEKCRSQDRNRSIKKYDSEYFQEQLRDCIEDPSYDYLEEKETIDFENEYEAYEFLSRHYPDLLGDGIDGYDYTYGYIWVCYAIAYGIRWYDNAHKKIDVPVDSILNK